MKSKVSKALAGALITGLVAGASAYADNHKGKSGEGADTAKEKQSCKGHKDNCKGKAKDKKHKADKNSCQGKDGCGGKDDAHEDGEDHSE